MAMQQSMVARAQMSQQLRMTPQLQQAIKLLQLSRMELIELVQQEMVENPVLEEVQDSYETESLYEREMGIEGERDKKKKQDEENTPDVEEVKADESDIDKVDWENYIEDFSTPLPTNSHKGLSTADLPGLEETLSTSESLVDALTEQVRMRGFDEVEQRIALLFIGNLDEYGYLRGQNVQEYKKSLTPSERDDLDELEAQGQDIEAILSVQTCAEIAHEVGVEVERVENVLDVLQSFEPVGVFARNLEECLLIQLERLSAKDKTVTLAKLIVREHIPNLERKSFGKISRETDKTKDEVIEAAKLIASLEPRPARGYDTGDPRYITPDIYIRHLGGEFVAVLNEDGLPKLKVSSYYKRELQKKKYGEDAGKALSATVKKIVRELTEEDDSRSSEEVYDHLVEQGHDPDRYALERFLEGLYIQDKLRGASWLIRSIYQRQSTIVKVTESIIKFQKDFFEKGVEHLKPLVLRDVADDIEMHESTVSRVTTNKYVHTPRGIFELKFFFNSSITKHGGDDLASEAVKAKIREIIAQEDPKKPLSDSKIVGELAEEGIDIARRTVAKYREMMGILSSSMRKQVF